MGEMAGRVQSGGRASYARTWNGSRVELRAKVTIAKEEDELLAVFGVLDHCATGVGDTTTDAAVMVSSGCWTTSSSSIFAVPEEGGMKLRKRLIVAVLPAPLAEETEDLARLDR